MDKFTGILRQVLSAGAGYLLGKGYIQESDVEPLIAAATLIATTVWSVMAKLESFPRIK